MSAALEAIEEINRNAEPISRGEFRLFVAGIFDPHVADFKSTKMKVDAVHEALFDDKVGLVTIAKRLDAQRDLICKTTVFIRNTIVLSITAGSFMLAIAVRLGWI